MLIYSTHTVKESTPLFSILKSCLILMVLWRRSDDGPKLDGENLKCVVVVMDKVYRAEKGARSGAQEREGALGACRCFEKPRDNPTRIKTEQGRGVQQSAPTGRRKGRRERQLQKEEDMSRQQRQNVSTKTVGMHRTTV